MLKYLLIVAVFCALPLPVVASPSSPFDRSRPIAYSARYYLPPGSRGTSHFHLYRINADGTKRTQLTFGSADDTDPLWSPDGKWIAFGRANEFDSDKYTLSVLDVATGRVRKLGPCSWYEFRPDYFWKRDPLRLVLPAQDWSTAVTFYPPNWKASPDWADLMWRESPSGKWRTHLVNGDHLTIQARIGQAWRTVFSEHDLWSDSAWLGAGRLAALLFQERTSPAGDADQLIALFDLKGASRIDLGRHLIRKIPQAYGIAPWPSHPDNLVLESQEYNSTTGGTMDFDDYSLKTGKLRPLAPFSEFLSFSPDGSRFATAPARDTVLYSHWHGGQVRSVWAAPLYVVDTQSGKKRRLTPLTTWVYSADWRKP